MVVNENIICERLSMLFLRSIEQVANSDRRCGRNLDAKYPSWKVVYYYFSKWQKDGTWSYILSYLVEIERIRNSKFSKPSAVAIDSQSVKKCSFVSLETGIDGNKYINGRKRHLAVDTLGLPIVIHVSAANVHDGREGIELLWQLEKASERLQLIRADHAYLGYFSECVNVYNWKIEISQKPESSKGFVPQSGRWQVERSFSWLNRTGDPVF